MYTVENNYLYNGDLKNKKVYCLLFRMIFSSVPKVPIDFALSFDLSVSKFESSI